MYTSNKSELVPVQDWMRLMITKMRTRACRDGDVMLIPANSGDFVATCSYHESFCVTRMSCLVAGCCYDSTEKAGTPLPRVAVQVGSSDEKLVLQAVKAHSIQFLYQLEGSKTRKTCSTCSLSGDNRRSSTIVDTTGLSSLSAPY